MAPRLGLFLIKDVFSLSKISAFNGIFGQKLLPLIKTHENASVLTNHYKPGDHLLFFNPSSGQCKQDVDGYFSYLSPIHALKEANLENPPLFKRRMWTQGSLEFLSPLEELKHYDCYEKIKYVKTLGPKTFVNIERVICESSISTGDGHDMERGNFSVLQNQNISPSKINIKENRMLMYTNELFKAFSNETESAAVIKTDWSSLNNGSFILTQEDIKLYSKLTSNPHKIHLDSNYCRKVEGFDDVIVQGPLSVQLLLSALYSFCRPRKKQLNAFNYKNRAPILAGTKLKILIAEDCNQD
ncbi:hypothetical protein ACO0QE_000551 [Hanseniaspora vineae]